MGPAACVSQEQADSLCFAEMDPRARDENRKRWEIKKDFDGRTEILIPQAVWVAVSPQVSRV